MEQPPTEGLDHYRTYDPAGAKRSSHKLALPSAPGIALHRRRGLMSVQYAAMHSRHASREPGGPTARHPSGGGSSALHTEYLPSSLRTTWNSEASRFVT